MMLRTLFAHKATKLGIGAAFIFQVVFFVVWLTAYDGVEDRTDQMTIAIVNDDALLHDALTKQLEYEAPFTFTFVTDLEEAKTDLNNRTLNMVMHIPASFTANLQEGEQGNIAYYINQSTPSVAKQMMETAATAMTSEINREVYAFIEEQMREVIPDVVGEQIPQEEQAPILASLIVEQIQQMIDVDMIKAYIHKENEVEGFSATMIPLMVVLAAYIGAMLMSQQMQIASKEAFPHENRFRLFFNRQIINIGVSFGLSVITLCIILLFDVKLTASIISVWLFQSILFLCFLSISQLFVIVFGHLGMIFNVVLTATQLVSSGAIVPRELLSMFYTRLGDVLPATYGVNGYFSIIYGGGNIMNELIHLLVMIGGLWILTCAFIWIFHINDKRNVNEHEMSINQSAHL